MHLSFLRTIGILAAFIIAAFVFVLFLTVQPTQAADFAPSLSGPNLDLTGLGTGTAQNQLWATFRNSGNTKIWTATDKDRTNISFWLAWADEAGNPVVGTNWYYLNRDVRIDALEPNETVGPFSLTSSANATVFQPHGTLPTETNAALSLTEMIATAPRTAERLLVIIDGPNNIFELDETDNSMTIQVKKPNLRLTGLGTGTAQDQLWVTYKNDSTAPLRPNTADGQIKISFWFAWADAAGQPVADSHWYYIDRTIRLLNPNEEIGPHFFASDSNAPVFSMSASGSSISTKKYSLTELIAEKPASAETLMVMIDGPDEIIEATEDDNRMAIRFKKPNLRLRGMSLNPETLRLYLSYANNGEGPIHSTINDDKINLSFWFTFADDEENTFPGATWYYINQEILVSALEPGEELNNQQFVFDPYRPTFMPHGTISSNVGAKRSFYEILEAAPAGASRLFTVIDGPNNIVEADETDNSMSLPFSKPNFKLSGLSLNPATLNFSGRYENAGNAPFYAAVGADKIPVSFWFAWAGANGKPLHNSRWYYINEDILTSALEPDDETLTIQFVFDPARARFFRHGARPDALESRLSFLDVIAEAPDNAEKIFVLIDGPNRFKESNENDNSMAIGFSKPNLKMKGISLNPETRKLYLSYENNGSAPIQSNSDRLNLSFWFAWANADNNPVPGTQWYYINQEILASALEAGAGINNQQLVFDPARPTFYPHGVDPSNTNAKKSFNEIIATAPNSAEKLLAIIDGANNIVETDEFDNSTTVQFSKSNLRITDLSLDSTTRRFSAHYENAGAAPIYPTVGTDKATISFWFAWTNQSGNPLSTSNWYYINQDIFTSYLEPGDEPLEIQFVFDPDRPQFFPHYAAPNDTASKKSFNDLIAEAPENAKRIFVLIDGPNWFKESKENDNSMTIRFELPQPEIELKLEPEPEINQPEEPITPATEINREITTPTIRALPTEDEEPTVIEETPVIEEPTIIEEPKRTVTPPVTRPMPTTESPRIPEPENKIPKAEAGVDVSITDDSNSGSAYITLDGSGSYDSDGNIVKWEWKLGERTVGIKEKPTFFADIGDHTVTLTITDDDGATDQDTVSIQVLPQPQPPSRIKGTVTEISDLEIYSISLRPGLAEAGQKITFAGTVLNSGTKEAAASSTRFNLDVNNDKRLDYRPSYVGVKALAAGEREEANWKWEWTAVAGTHSIEICADIGGAVEETDETNNCKEYIFNVSEQPETKPKTKSRRLIF